MNAKKLLTLALAIATLTATLASCASGDSGAASDTTAADNAAQTTAAETEPEKITYLSANLPEMDYEGYEFRFRQVKPTYDRPWWYIHSDEQTGEVLNDATYKRNAAIEEAFNVDFSVTFGDTDDKLLADVQNLVNAGDDAFDAVYIQLGRAIKLFKGEMLNDLNTIENLNPQAQWWDQGFVRDLAVNDKLYYIAGDLTPLMTLRAYSMVFNKDMADSLGIEYPYDAVREGQWTMEYFTKYVQGVNSDVNGDGLMDYEDRWGFFSENVASTIMFISFGGRVIDKDADDNLVFVADTEKNLDRLNSALEIIINKETTLWCNPLVQANGNNWSVASEWFAAGGALLRSSTFENVPRDYRTMDADFGVVPCPKYDEAQENYLTNASETGNVITLPKTVVDTARSGLIIEALAAESVSTTTPALYDVCINGKYVRDEESIDMIDIIFNNKVYDWGYMFQIGGFRSEMINLEKAYSTDISSMLAKIETKMATELAEYAELYSK